MDFNELLDMVGDEAVFESSLLLAGDVNPAYLRLQLSRWVKSGKIYQLRRGLYAIASPYQRTKPHPFTVANRLVRASYVSLQSALAYWGLIPEILFSTTSITTKRPQRFETVLGNYDFRHIQIGYLFGYQTIDLGERQSALVASPEKALLDLMYLTPGGHLPQYLQALRLQHLERIDLAELARMGKKFDSKKVSNGIETIRELIQNEESEYRDL